MAGRHARQCAGRRRDGAGFRHSTWVQLLHAQPAHFRSIRPRRVDRAPRVFPMVRRRATAIVVRAALNVEGRPTGGRGGALGNGSHSRIRGGIGGLAAFLYSGARVSHRRAPVAGQRSARHTPRGPRAAMSHTCREGRAPAAIAAPDGLTNAEAAKASLLLCARFARTLI